jgi:CRP/FNR family transcriptional regulator
MSPSPIAICPAHGVTRTASCEDCLVRHLAICGALSRDELIELEKMLSKRALEAGQQLIAEGEKGHFAYSVQQGCLKLFKSLSDGRRQIVGFLLPGDFIGLPARGDYMYSAEAVERTEVCRFPQRGFEHLFQNSPDLEHRILSIVRDEMVAAQNHMLLLGRRTARERLACFLLDFRERYLEQNLPVDVMRLPMSRMDIADYLGLTVETVSRMFSQMRREGLLVLPRSDSVSIPDIAKLEAITEPG